MIGVRRLQMSSKIPLASKIYEAVKKAKDKSLDKITNAISGRKKPPPVSPKSK